MRLENRVAIVTGGGSGIGTAYTRRFLAEGAKVMIADIGEEQGTRTAAELAGDGDVAFVRTDIADPAERAGGGRRDRRALRHRRHPGQQRGDLRRLRRQRPQPRVPEAGVRREPARPVGDGQGGRARTW